MWTQWKFILCSYRWPVLDSEIFKWNNHNLGQKYKNFCYTGSMLECMYITFICVCIYIYIYQHTVTEQIANRETDYFSHEVDPMNCCLPGSSVHGILQARILQWVAMPSSRGSFWPRDWTCDSSDSPALQVDSLPLNHWGSLQIAW